MEELNQASETLDKQVEKSVKIVYRPPATIAYLYYDNVAAPDLEDGSRKEAETILKKFIEDTDLFKIKPDMRVCGGGGIKKHGDWHIWVTIPSDFDVPAPLEKRTYPGGLYTTSTNPDADAGIWVETSDEYDWDRFERIICEEYFNPFNIYNLKDTGFEIPKSMYTQTLFPIKKTEKPTDEQKEKINAAVTALEKSASSSESVEIDLASMVSQNNKDDFNVHYENGLMIMYKGGVNEGGGMITQEKFTGPVKIELRAKTDKAYIHIVYGEMCIIMEWRSMGGSSLLVVDHAYGEWET